MAENPAVQTLSEWTWHKVATNVTSGFINRLDSSVYYYQTYRVTGGTAPTTITAGTIPTEAIRIFDQSTQAEIQATDPIDIYIFCQNDNEITTDFGKIRVDL